MRCRSLLSGEHVEEPPPDLPLKKGEEKDRVWQRYRGILDGSLPL